MKKARFNTINEDKAKTCFSLQLHSRKSFVSMINYLSTEKDYTDMV